MKWMDRACRQYPELADKAGMWKGRIALQNGGNRPFHTKHTTHAPAGAGDDPNVGFEERAAIAEYDGGLPRAHAEVLAALETVLLHGYEDDGQNLLSIVALRLEKLLGETGEQS